MVQGHPLPRKPGSELPEMPQSVRKDRNSHRAEPIISTANEPAFSLLTVKEVSAILKLSPRTVRRMIADERLSVVRLGRAVRIRPEVITALIEGK